MRRYVLLPMLLAACFAGAIHGEENMGGDESTPAFTPIPELTEGFHALYAQNFMGAREKFSDWETHNPEQPFGEVAIAASYLFEEFYRQGVLTSDFFLNEKKFLSGIDGKPDAAQMAKFQDALGKTRALANRRLQENPKDQEALFALTLAAGMESDADMILRKERLDALKLLKQANEYAKQLLQTAPDADDAYVALGSANYIIGSLSGGMRFILTFGGVHGDKKLGMQQLGEVRGQRALFETVCEDYAGAGGAAGKTECAGAEAVAGTERGISFEPAVCSGVCEGHGAAGPGDDCTRNFMSCQDSQKTKPQTSRRYASRSALEVERRCRAAAWPLFCHWPKRRVRT